MEEKETAKSGKSGESFGAKFLLATVPAILIAFATNMINKKQAAGEKQEIRHELAMQLSKSLENSNEKLNHWIEKYEALSNKYNDLRQQVGAAPASGQPRAARAENRPREENPDIDEPAPVAASDITGTWRTPDGTVVWTFANGRIEVSSSELLPGMLSGSGSYRQT